MASAVVVADITTLRRVAEGQMSRKIHDKSKEGYLCKAKIMSHILNSIPEIRADALVLDAQGVALKHTGKASKVLQMKLPMTPDHAQLLFSQLAIVG